MPEDKKGSWPPSELEEKTLEFTRDRYEPVLGLSDYNHSRFQRALDELRDVLPDHRLEEILFPIADAVHELSEQGHIDVLTKLPNRRALMVNLRREFLSAHRTPHHPLACMLVDIDHFKRLNDTYGHPVGDACLRLFGYIFCEQEYSSGATRATGLVRGTDYVGRYGGEEFFILLSKVSSQEDAYTVAERIRRTLETHTQNKKWLRRAFDQLNIHLPGLEKRDKEYTSPPPGSYLSHSEGVRNQATELQIGLHEFPSYTISIGVCFYNPEKKAIRVTHDVLLAAADKALYESKRKGRNRVTLWQGSLEGFLDNK